LLRVETSERQTVKKTKPAEAKKISSPKAEDKSGSSNQFAATKCFRNTSNEFWLQVRIGLETFRVSSIEEVK
jgi:hypothetical protein